VQPVAHRHPPLFRIITSGIIAGPVAAHHEFSGGPILVNGQKPDSQKGYALMRDYGAIAAGNYWYDPVSASWGNSGGSTAARIAPGLDLGSRLQANASGGGTGVFINGREIHRSEYGTALQLYGSVIPGRGFRVGFGLQHQYLWRRVDE
jgi:hypothetical protein